MVSLTGPESNNEARCAPVLKRPCVVCQLSILATLLSIWAFMSEIYCAASRKAARGSLQDWVIYGVDFSSAPSVRKPITVAQARLVRASCPGPPLALEVNALIGLTDWSAFERFLETPGPWVGGFDFPFGLPRELVQTLDWPLRWPDLVRHFESLSREVIRERFRAFCAARPVGGKFAHRATDRPAGSSPSMKWVNPPVAWMFQTGAPRLLRADLHLPGLLDGDRERVALEAYPGMVARSVTRRSYKSDDPRQQDATRRAARSEILAALTCGAHRLGVPVRCVPDVTDRLADDPGADWLDAVICAVQAGWALQKGSNWGLPPTVDPLEGWIVGA